jgi:nucleoside-diphosphate-sugar epimerase
MRLLVTGGSGFLGGYVLREAARRGHVSVALARSMAAARTAAERGAQPVPGDLDDAGQLHEAFAAARCEVLLNLASLGFGHGPAILAAVEEAGIGRAVFVSTTAVTTNLAPPTKSVRLAAERQIRSSRLQWTIVRPTMIYGAQGDRNMSRLLALLRRTPLLPVPGGGRHLQQPVHVEDVADAILTASERPTTAGMTYNVAGPEPISFTDLLLTSARAVGSRARFFPVPLTPMIALARGHELLSHRPRIRAEQLLRLAEDKAFVIDDATRDLCFAPRPFAEGIHAQARAMGLAT